MEGKPQNQNYQPEGIEMDTYPEAANRIVRYLPP